MSQGPCTRSHLTTHTTPNTALVGSDHLTTVTARAPRDSTTNTWAPMEMASSDHARKVSEPPRILISTSPGPFGPRVAWVRTPTRPTAVGSPSMGARLSSTAYLMQTYCAGDLARRQVTQ